MTLRWRRQVVSFLYHEVTDDPSSSGFQRPSALPYKHGIAEFEQNLDAIQDARVPVSRVHELDPGTKEPATLITFDDGGKSNLHSADALEKRGWKGHFFITTSRIGDKTFLSASEIQELHQRGHVIGSHSHNHPDVFYAQTYEEMMREWTDSRDILANVIGEAIHTAAVPGGEMDRRTQLSAQEAGFSFLFTSEPRLHPWQLQSLTCLGRVGPKAGTPIPRVAALARRRGFLKEKAVRRIKTTLRRTYRPIQGLLSNKS